MSDEITLPCPVCEQPAMEPVEVQYESEPLVLRCVNNHLYAVDLEERAVYELEGDPNE